MLSLGSALKLPLYRQKMTLLVICGRNTYLVWTDPLNEIVLSSRDIQWYQVHGICQAGDFEENCLTVAVVWIIAKRSCIVVLIDYALGSFDIALG